MATDYSKSCVYQITWKETIYYVGSSKKFKNRETQHKSSYKNENDEKYNKPLYKFLRDNGGWTNEWTMTIIQSYPDCKSRKELLEYEREHYEILKPLFNKCRPIVRDGELSEIHKQYRLENAEKIKESNKQYKLENAEKIKEKNRLYKLENAEIISEKGKIYYEENVERIKEKDRLYKLENAEKITEKNRLYKLENAEKINKLCVCACGANYTHNHESRHKKTIKHQKFVEEQKTM
jgi:GIY-YIG catalytic domain